MTRKRPAVETRPETAFSEGPKAHPEAADTRDCADRLTSLGQDWPEPVAFRRRLRVLEEQLEAERHRADAAEAKNRQLKEQSGIWFEAITAIYEQSTSWRVTRSLRRTKQLATRLFGSQMLTPIRHRIGRLTDPKTDEYAAWVVLYDTISEADRRKLSEMAGSFKTKPLISVLMPVYNTDPRYLRLAIESVRRQIYPHWELCLADDHSSLPGVRECLEEMREADSRIKVAYRQERGHISAATNSALELATGDFVALVDADDEIPKDALFWVAREIDRAPDVDLIYSDEDKIDEVGRRSDPYFKPDWNPALIQSQNMFSHLGVFRRSLVVELGGMRSGFEGSQDHDLTLRCADASHPERIRHIPRVLYHWRVLPTSTAAGSGAKPYAWDAGRRAILEHLNRHGVAATVERRLSDFYQVVHERPPTWPKVTVIIPTTLRSDVSRRCVQNVIRDSSYTDLEVILPVHTRHADEAVKLVGREAGVKIVTYDETPFNFSWVNNFAVRHATGEVICFLNDDVEPITPDWLERMASRAHLPDVGAVGAMLYYPNDSIQHAGVVLGVGGVADHAFRTLPRTHAGYFGRANLEQDLSCVTAACMMVKRKAFQDAGGFDENMPCAFNDVDLCLKLRQNGWRILWTPTVEMYHHESLTFGHHASAERAEQFQSDVLKMHRRWGLKLMFDEYYNPNLSVAGGKQYRLSFPPRVTRRGE